MNLGMEDEYTEHKRSTSELREAMESVASILNKHGHGTLYFGVRPSDGEVVGQDVSEKTLRDISQAFTNHIEPRVYPTIEHLTTDDGKSYVKAAFSGSERPYSCDGRYRIRSADEDLPMNTPTLEQMMLERASRKIAWDRRPSGKTVRDVDEELLREYVHRGVECRRIPFEYTNATDVLSRLELLCDDGTLTNAAAICFTPSRDTMLRMGVFADSQRVHILDNHQETGTLFGLVDTAELYILNNIRRAFIIDGTSLHRREKPEIPLASIREALFNAFCHRLYEDDAAVQVDIFWDSVDIYSPGLFPTGYTPEAYLSGELSASKPRNQLIARTLYRSGDIETYGTGLQRIKRECDEQGVPVEVFERGNAVHVRFMRQEGIAAGLSDTESQDSAGKVRESPDEFGNSSGKVREKFGKELSERELQVLEYLEKEGLVSSQEVMGLVSITDRGAQRLLNRLINIGLVTKVGSGRKTRYKLVDLDSE